MTTTTAAQIAAIKQPASTETPAEKIARVHGMIQALQNQMSITDYDDVTEMLKVCNILLGEAREEMRK